MNSKQVDSTSEASLIGFLKANVPRDYIPNIESELKKDFVFAKKKSKVSKCPKKKKKVCLKRKEKKSLGFYNLPREGMKYTDWLDIHNIWNEYICQVLEIKTGIPNIGTKGWDTFTQSLYKVDLHGCLLKVVRSKCPSYVDRIGICILDTRNTFKIITEENKVITIPKKHCVFDLFVKNNSLRLFGKQLCVRPAERTTKKIKAQQHPDL